MAMTGGPWFEVRTIPGKDMGVVAVRDIPRGIRILAEKALAKVELTQRENEEETGV